ncbi:MAG: transcriptional regulator [Candidatus Thermoplasmatota archaeon]
MERNELLVQIRETLGTAGFTVSEVYNIRLSGFDILARKDDTLLIIKVLTNIDSFSEDVAQELRTLCSILHATPLLIGEHNGFNKLEDDVVYLRFGVQAITINTLKSYLYHKDSIRIYAGPGGLYVRLDEEKLKKLRQEKNISLGSFARHVNVSRKTVQMYEEGMNARVDVAERIEELLENSVITPIDVFKNPDFDADICSLYNQALHHFERFQREIFLLLQEAGYKIFPLDKFPFEAVSKEKEKILLTCIQKYNANLSKRAQIINSISKITEKHAVVITDKDNKQNIHGTPVIAKKELKKLRDPEEVLRLIIERTIICR